MSIKYIGLDAHMSTCTFCVLDKKGIVLDNRTIVTNGRLLVEYIQSIPGKKMLTVEECNLSSWLFEILKQHVNEVIVCNPVENRQYKKAKTDKLDAHQLAQLLRGGFLKPVFHDGSDREKLRIIVSAYQDVVNDMVRLQNRHRALVTHSGVRSGKRESFSFQCITENLIKQLKVLDEVKTTYQDLIKAHTRCFKETKCLTSLPGIGPIQSAKIIAKVIEPRRFKNKYKFFAYCGLVHHQRMSGGRHYGTNRIWGNSTLKCVFKMAAHSAIRGSSSLRKLYDVLRAKGLSDKDAANAVARKIAALSLALWKNNQRYNDAVVLQSLPS
jgi:transposase